MGMHKKLDIRCGFSKQFLDEKLDDINISQIWFKEGNRIEWNLNYGCGVFVNPKSSSSPLEILKVLEDSNSADYVPWRSFFYKLSGYSTFEFENQAVTG